jgi:hypothetical protein
MRRDTRLRKIENMISVGRRIKMLGDGSRHGGGGGVVISVFQRLNIMQSHVSIADEWRRSME